jgi:FkbM family methyltransferase
LEQNDSLIVIGIDALRSNIYNELQSKSKRFIGMEGVCSSKSVNTTEFYIHTSATCGSLLSVKPDAPALGSGTHACTQDKPRIVQVKVFHLGALLQQVRKLFNIERIEFLKLDVQGAELDCLTSCYDDELENIDNILVEVQDVVNTSSLAIYAGAPTLDELNAFFIKADFYLQYCEWNRWSKHIRELNCLYSRHNGTWMWATGNGRLNRSMVSYDSNPPDHLDLVKHLHTLYFPGERIQKKRSDYHFQKKRYK